MAHWYHPTTGLLLPPVEQQNGKWHDAGLREARLVAALPSVTTIISLLDKPGLTAWKYEQVIEATIRFPTWSVSEILADAFAKVDLAADFGTQVHAGISNYLNLHRHSHNPNIRIMECVNGFITWYESQTDIDLVDSEQTFTNIHWGFAGTLDGIGTYHGQPAIFDYKTQDAETARDFKVYDPDWPLQMAGYALGTDRLDYKRVSIIISRTKPGLIKVKEWHESDRYDWMWLSLLSFWCDEKKYWPGDGRK